MAKKPDISLFKFTPAELKIAGFLALGYSRKDIAGETGNAVNTVDFHLKAIRNKKIGRAHV